MDKLLQNDWMLCAIACGFCTFFIVCISVCMFFAVKELERFRNDLRNGHE